MKTLDELSIYIIEKKNLQYGDLYLPVFFITIECAIIQAWFAESSTKGKISIPCLKELKLSRQGQSTIKPSIGYCLTTQTVYPSCNLEFLYQVPCYICIITNKNLLSSKIGTAINICAQRRYSTEKHDVFS